MSKIEIVSNGITDLHTDAVVNAANEGLWEGGGVCGVIFRAAGSRELTKACNAIGHCDTGSAVITPAFALKDAKYIIHAVGPRWSGGKNNEADLLFGAYYKSLELAKENGCRSIGFPLISAGIFGYPVKEAWFIAIRACRKFMMDNPDYEILIRFGVPSEDNRRIGNETLEKPSFSGFDAPAIGGKLYPKGSRIVKNPDGTITVVPPKKSTREDRIEVFNDTIAWVEDDSDLAASVVSAKKNTEVVYEDDYPDFDPDRTYETEIAVTKHRSYEAAMLLAKDNPGSRIAVMNFANAFHAGGGVTKGSSAQEESLCRTSTLYPLLYRRTLRDTFYAHHKTLNTPKASDSLIYTKGVVICKTDEDFPERLPKKDWVTVDVITIAAPDLRKKSNQHAELVAGGTYMNNAELFGYHVKRAIHMLTVAASKGAEILVLGAFGCGAFENDPDVVAKAYKTVLDVFPKVFKKIEFAVYCTPKDSKNYDAFSNAFK